MSVQPEAIVEWLRKEMGYRPPSLAKQSHAGPSAETMRKICRGNMIPVFNFLVRKVKSEKTAENIRRNIVVHGGKGEEGLGKGAGGGGRVGKKEKEREIGGRVDERVAAEKERDAAEKETKRLRRAVRRMRKDVRARMLEVAREEAERKRMIDERGNYRHKQVMLESYDQQCDEAVKIFAEYHKRLQFYVNQARDAQKTSQEPSSELDSIYAVNSDKEAVFSTVKGTKSTDDVILIETTREKNVRRACESLAAYMIDKVRVSFPAYEGGGIHSSPQLEAAKLGFDFDGEVPDEVRTVIGHCLKSPPLLLQAITAYASRLRTLISRDIEKIDIRADAEMLRYKYENNRVMDVNSSDGSSPLSYQAYGNGKFRVDPSTKGSENQLLERQKAHVQQFLATEDALNKAAEARDSCQKLIQVLHGGGDVVSSMSNAAMGKSQNISSLRQLELEVWAREREAAGLRASLNTLMSEIERLDKLCEERKEAEDSLRKKWKKIEQFDARRSELEAVYAALLKGNMDAASFWDQQPLGAREFASTTIIPACTVVVDISTSAKDLIDKEVSAFCRSPDNSLYMLPSTPQALLESVGSNGLTGIEAFSMAEKNAALLTARAGARDPSAVPSICRVSAALQYPAGLEGSDAILASVLESLEFCMKLRGSEACVLEDLSKAINLVHTRQELVESSHTLLNHAYRALQEYERATSYCLNLAADQEKTVTEKWLPELRSTNLNAQNSLEDCKHVAGLINEWWEQPAATVVDWVTVDGQNVATWLNHVKQLLAFYDKGTLMS
ncbi:hypothetical protein MLD38_001273 [Melastoma candidum]|uniref:Uncharacterized protein n=1 Tax=Melastoma candidum TaxID=119954 RepID=A0ACB9SLC5_9MYRT|nr:hypothetical protein MLD38_001273 [Melastoma candidum]